MGSFLHFGVRLGTLLKAHIVKSSIQALEGSGSVGLSHRLTALAKRAQADHQEYNRSEWTQWVSKALQGGASLAHRWTNAPNKRVVEPNLLEPPPSGSLQSGGPMAQ